MFSYFESSVDGIIPNEYTSLENICTDFVGFVVRGKEYFMLIVRQCWGVQQQYVSTDFIRKISKLKINDMVEETTAATVAAAAMASNVIVSSTVSPSSKPLTMPMAKSHELTLDPKKITTATMQTNKLRSNNDFANNLDNHMRHFDKRLITDSDTFVLNYRGEVNKKVI